MMTLRGYYLRAARFQRACDRFNRWWAARDAIAGRHARLVCDHLTYHQFCAARRRAEHAQVLARRSAELAAIARFDARDRMYFDPWVAAREDQQREFIRRNWS